MGLAFIDYDVIDEAHEILMEIDPDLVSSVATAAPLDTGTIPWHRVLIVFTSYLDQIKQDKVKIAAGEMVGGAGLYNLVRWSSCDVYLAISNGFKTGWN